MHASHPSIDLIPPVTPYRRPGTESWNSADATVSFIITVAIIIVVRLLH